MALHDQLQNDIETLRQWAATAQGTTVTTGNAVAVLQAVINNLGTFYSHFADLLAEVTTESPPRF